MACPLFLPSTPLGDFEDVYGGECASDPGALVPEDVLRAAAIQAMRAGVVERAALTDADSFRFLIKSVTHGTVEVAWSIERDHHPVAVGALTVTGIGDTQQPTAGAPGAGLRYDASSSLNMYLMLLL